MKRISELLGKKAVHSGPPVITYKITVEQVLATSVIGWAASSDLAPAEAFHLLVDDVVQEVTATHIHRLDVCRAIGASDQLSFGFRIALPLSLWNDSGELQAREVMLCAGNERKHLELAHTLSDWPSELEANSSHTEFSNISLELLNQLAAKDRQSQLKEEDLSYYQLLARKLGWRNWPTLQQPAPEGLLEQSASLVWTGWIVDDSDLAQAFQLFVNGHEVQIEPIRVNRSDVAEAKSLNRTDLGFEISIPASIWGHASEKSSVTLELWAGSCRLTQENIVWDLSKLTSILKDCYLKSGGTQFPREVLTLSGEGQYYFLLCLEHFLACRQEVELERSVRSWFRHHAEIYGVKVEEELKDEAPLLNPPRHAISTIELWRLLRAFNAAVQEDGSNAKEAFQEIWQRSDIDVEVRHQLTCALIPYFCGIDRYFEIRPFLDISRLKIMAADTNAWSLSLQIPEATWTADYALATQLTSKIAYEAKGWINTECIATACRRLLHAWPPTPQHQYEAETTASAILNVLEAQSFDYWRRSHDKHLVDAATSLIMLSRRITSSFAYKALTTIILHYEFNPHFWKTLAERWDSFSFWPAELKIAHRNFIRFRYALTESTPQLSTVIEAVLPAALKGSLDASIALRDAALCAALNTKTNSETELQKGVSAACTTSPNEIIRFLSHFHASSVDNIETAAATEIVERCSGVPRTYFTSRKNSLIEWLWKQSPIQANITLKELPLLCGIEAHGIGVLIAALFAERQHRFNETNSDQVTLAEVSRHWLKLFHGTANQSIPPSALLQACQLLIDWQANPDAPKDVARIAFEFRRLLCERYGDDISEVCSGPTKLAHPTVRSQDPVKSTLVAIYTCNKYLSSRIAAIQNTWAKKLDELEIPWIIVVGNGDDSFDGRVLSLNVLDNYESLPQKSIALIKWVYNNTNFSHLFKIDDDCHVAVERLFHQSPQWGHHYLGRKLTRGLGTTDRSWHRARSESTLAKNSLDKSPEPSVYADGGSGYFLSRFAMFSVLQALSSTEGARLTRSAYMEDKLIGDLLSLKGINLSEEGYDTLVRRRFGDDPVRVCAFSNSFYPSQVSPTMVCHLDDAEKIPEISDRQSSSILRPEKIWPSYAEPKVYAADGTNQLELLSDHDKISKAIDAEVIVVSVARNEMTLMPHFLAHYRSIGVQCFIIVDNLSDDGTRAYLLQQPDVLLYSADTEYKKSHYGVAWQQAVLSSHALGKWVILADIDEFLVFPSTEEQDVSAWLGEISKTGHTAVNVFMIDMYPGGSLDDCDFRMGPPFELAPLFEGEPLIRWKLGSGCFSNSATWLSGLRHRLIEDSAPNLYTSQKVAILKYFPWMRLSEGLHYVSNIEACASPCYFAHFKYHAGFKEKVLNEVQRRQHFNDAEEYQKYLGMLTEGNSPLSTETSKKFSSYLDYKNATGN